MKFYPNTAYLFFHCKFVQTKKRKKKEQRKMRKIQKESPMDKKRGNHSSSDLMLSVSVFATASED